MNWRLTQKYFNKFKLNLKTNKFKFFMKIIKEKDLLVNYLLSIILRNFIKTKRTHGCIRLIEKY